MSLKFLQTHQNVFPFFVCVSVMFSKSCETIDLNRLEINLQVGVQVKLSFQVGTFYTFTFITNSKSLPPTPGLSIH